MTTTRSTDATRAERFEGRLITEFPDADILAGSLIQDLLAIADDRTLLTLLDLAERLGQPPSTTKSWIDRHERGIKQWTKRTVTPPPIAYQTRSGPLWDAEVVEAWIAEQGAGHDVG